MGRVTKLRSGASQRTEVNDELVEFLRNSAAYGDGLGPVECVETHISWVFITDEFAYKLKKPVRFDFLDFSTSELRRKACEDEVRLNRRLARHVYLGVLPVTHRHGQLSLNGEGTPVDWVVKMRRLPADRSLDRLIQSSGIETQGAQQIALLLSQFFAHLPPLTIRPDDYRRRLDDHVRHNRDQLLANKNDVNQGVIRRIHEAQILLLHLVPETFGNRALDGRIVEGHGDLRPEHIYLAPAPTIIDCIEFSAELRQLDVLDELCFLAMECERLNAGWIGDEVIAQYRSVSGDQWPERLAAFYKCYRACVRAKVSTLRADQTTGQNKARAEQLANDYLRLADKLREELGRPVLLIVRGLSGTGKTTLAQELSEVLEIERLETDAIRRELFGVSQSPAEYGMAIYQPESRARVYEEMLRRAKILIDSGCSAILDGTFLTTKSRTDALVLAAAGRAVPLVIQCHCPNDVARQRIAARLAAGRSRSESRPDIHAGQKEDEEPDPPDINVCRVDATASLPAMVKLVLKRLGADWISAN